MATTKISAVDRYWTLRARYVDLLNIPPSLRSKEEAAELLRVTHAMHGGKAAYDFATEYAPIDASPSLPLKRIPYDTFMERVKCLAKHQAYEVVWIPQHVCTDDCENYCEHDGDIDESKKEVGEDAIAAFHYLYWGQPILEIKCMRLRNELDYQWLVFSKRKQGGLLGLQRNAEHEARVNEGMDRIEKGEFDDRAKLSARAWMRVIAFHWKRHPPKKFPQVTMELNYSTLLASSLHFVWGGRFIRTSAALIFCLHSGEMYHPYRLAPLFHEAFNRRLSVKDADALMKYLSSEEALALYRLELLSVDG